MSAQLLVHGKPLHVRMKLVSENASVAGSHGTGTGTG